MTDLSSCLVCRANELNSRQRAVLNTVIAIKAQGLDRVEEGLCVGHRLEIEKTADSLQKWLEQ